MLLEEIRTIANNSTDETFAETLIRNFTNEAIANINIAISAKLRYITEETKTDDYTDLDEEWIRSVVVPYVCYLIKVNDGSVNEASIAFFQRYQVGLSQMQKNRNRAVKPKFRFWWETASEYEFKIANQKLEKQTGTDDPDLTFLPDPWNVVPGTVAAVYTDDLSKVSFFKVEGGTGVKSLGTIGSNNVGWFNGGSPSSDKNGILGD